ncbi:hypothetical protein CHUAL_009486 [Chamberlinius hualienensis]
MAIATAADRQASQCNTGRRMSLGGKRKWVEGRSHVYNTPPGTDKMGVETQQFACAQSLLMLQPSLCLYRTATLRLRQRQSRSLTASTSPKAPLATIPHTHKP